MPDRDSIEASLRASLDAGALAGAATLVWRDGRVVQTATVGSRDLVTNLPVERDTIFRIVVCRGGGGTLVASRHSRDSESMSTAMVPSV
jgi:hypothetical protein